MGNYVLHTATAVQVAVGKKSSEGVYPEPWEVEVHIVSSSVGANPSRDKWMRRTKTRYGRRSGSTPLLTLTVCARTNKAGPVISRWM